MFKFKSILFFIYLITSSFVYAEDNFKANVRQPLSENDLYFNPILMNTSQGNIDVSRFEKKGAILPGTWKVDIYVNDIFIESREVLFKENKNKKVVPCLESNFIELIDLKNEFKFLDKKVVDPQGCLLLANLSSEIRVNYDPSIQKLSISVPQAIVNHYPRGYVSPLRWDSGMNALSVGYNANYYVSRSHGIENKSAYAGINGNVNFEGWRYHHQGNFLWSENSGERYNSTFNYFEKIIPSLRGVVRVGEMQTSGRLFDPQPLRGIQLFSDDSMLPESLRGYAPLIRGTARTNGRVIIRQNGQVIYETVVSPGPFEINDLYPTGYGGNLEVTIQEADGSEQHFTVYYASVVQLLRPGIHNYSLSAGRYHSSFNHYNPFLYEGIYRRGLTNLITGYAGIQGANSDYYAYQVGLALSTPLGAFSGDVTQSELHLEGERSVVNRGQSYQISYSKYLQETNSNVTVAAYKFSSEKFYDFSTAVQALNESKQGRSIAGIWRPKNRFNITVEQGLSETLGSFYVSGYTQDYWNQTKSDMQYQLGYNNQWDNISYGLNVGRIRNGQGKTETNFELNINLPIGSSILNSSQLLTASLSRNGNGNISERIGLSGTVGEESQYSYGVTGMNTDHGAGSSMTLNAAVRTSLSNVSASYGAGKHYQNASLGTAGSLLIWPEGLIATPYQGETFAIVEAKGAQGASVSGYPGIKINQFGHAAVPYLKPYQNNDIYINPKGMSNSVEFDNTKASIVPYQGAITRVIFKAKYGMPLLINIQGSLEPIPFGSVVYDENNQEVGNVGQGAQLYARVKNNQGKLIIKWGYENEKTCHVYYQLSPEQINSNNNFVHLTLTCEK